jgi:hypothetical protein
MRNANSHGRVTYQDRMRRKLNIDLTATINALTMAPAGHTDQEESDFMSSLLSSLDNSIKPKQQVGSLLSVRHASPPTRNTSNISSTSSATLVNEEDIAFLLEGAEDWDWDDDFMSPKKSPLKRSPVKSRSRQTANDPPRYNQTCTRCIVQSVFEDVSGDRLEKVCLCFLSLAISFVACMGSNFLSQNTNEIMESLRFYGVN